jgi:hypothetical protein
MLNHFPELFPYAYRLLFDLMSLYRKYRIRTVYMRTMLVPKQCDVLLALSCLLCITFLFSACSPGFSSQGNAALPASTMQTCTLEASWAMGFNNLSSLKKASDLAVVGTIASVNSVNEDTPGIPTTLFVFRISQVLWNPHHLTSLATVLVNQTGGIVHNKHCTVSDDPLFQVGEQAILFLHQYSPAHYFVNGGPSGRFSLQHDMVKPINNEGIVFAPLPLVDFITKVERA